MKYVTEVIHKKGSIIITFDHVHVINVEPELVIKYKLLTINNLDDDAFLSLIDENERLRALRFSFKKLKKMLTVMEMKTLLSEEKFDKKIVNDIIHYLIDRHYLDDLAYAKYYLSVKSNQYGPRLMAYKLIEKGISDNIINQIMTSYNELQFIEDIIEKKLRQPLKKTKKQTLEYLKRDLLSKGFYQENIDRALQKLHHLYQEDELKLLDNYAQKYVDSLSKRYQGYTLIKKLKDKLYQKGFNYDQIKAYLQSKDF